MIAPGTADDLSIVYEMLCANSDLAVVRVLPVSPPCNRVSSQQLNNAVQDLNRMAHGDEDRLYLLCLAMRRNHGGVARAKDATKVKRTIGRSNEEILKITRGIH